MGTVLLVGCTTKKEVSTQKELEGLAPETIARVESQNKETAELAQNDFRDDIKNETSTVSGEYTGDGYYEVHDGTVKEDIDFKFVIENDVVASFEMLGEASVPDSAWHQELFMEKATPKIVGKDIATLEIDVVSGASATTEGFRKALQDVREQVSKS